MPTITEPPPPINSGATGDSWNQVIAKVALWMVWIEENRDRDGFAEVFGIFKRNLLYIAECADRDAAYRVRW